MKDFHTLFWNGTAEFRESEPEVEVEKPVGRYHIRL